MIKAKIVLSTEFGVGRRVVNPSFLVDTMCQKKLVQKYRFLDTMLVFQKQIQASKAELLPKKKSRASRKYSCDQTEIWFRGNIRLKFTRITPTAEPFVDRSYGKAEVRNVEKSRSFVSDRRHAGGNG